MHAILLFNEENVSIQRHTNFFLVLRNVIYYIFTYDTFFFSLHFDYLKSRSNIRFDKIQTKIEDIRNMLFANARIFRSIDEMERNLVEKERISPAYRIARKVLTPLSHVNLQIK